MKLANLRSAIWSAAAKRKHEACLLALLLPVGCFAERVTTTAPNSNPNAPISAPARLDFITNIDKYLFLRMGTAGLGVIDTVTFNLTPSIPAASTIPSNGNNVTVSWNGGVPTFGSTTTTLPVEVRSNAGQVTLKATATALLSSGANNIPLSSIIISSSDAGLPAPLVPNTGTGATVNVTGTAFANFVTSRTAVWSFNYVNPVAPNPGAYTGQITFTASAP